MLAKFINQNKQTANERGHHLVYFSQKAKANNKFVTLSLAPPAFIIMSTKIPEVSFAVSLRLRTPFREVIPSQMKPVLRWTVF